MSAVSFFQHYSQRENHGTNNVVLLLRHLYATSPARYFLILKNAIEPDYEYAPTFELQSSLMSSIPDALLAQRAFRIYIESKAGGRADIPQAERHLQGIAALPNKDDAVLLCLTRDPLNNVDRTKLDALSVKYGVRIVDLTFSSLSGSVRDVVPIYDDSFVSILDDFDAFLDASGLADRGDRIFVPPTGTTRNENLALRMFFDPVSYLDRSHFKYLGLYNKKRVYAVGEISSVCEYDRTGDIRSLKGKAPDLERFEEIFAACPYYPNLRNEKHRFYFVDQFVETDLRKTSKGGIMGARVFHLRDPVDPSQPCPTTAIELANALRGREMPLAASQ